MIRNHFFNLLLISFGFSTPNLICQQQYCELYLKSAQEVIRSFSDSNLDYLVSNDKQSDTILLKISIMESTIKFDPDLDINWYMELMEDTLLLNSPIKVVSTNYPCNNYILQKLGNDLILPEKASLTFMTTRNEYDLFYIFSFSNILISDRKAFMFMKITAGINKRKFIVGFSFRNSEGEWSIEKMKPQPL